MQVATLVIALLGLVTSMFALGWNVAQYLLTGGRAKVELVVGAMAGRGMVTMSPGPNINRELASVAEQFGPSPRLIGVEVVNPGRTPIRVQRWGIECPNAASFWLVGDSVGPDLPATIDGGSKATWVTEMVHAARLASAGTEALGVPPVVRAVVELGTGKQIRSRKTLRIES